MFTTIKELIIIFAREIVFSWHNFYFCFHFLHHQKVFLINFKIFTLKIPFFVDVVSKISRNYKLTLLIFIFLRPMWFHVSASTFDFIKYSVKKRTQRIFWVKCHFLFHIEETFFFLLYDDLISASLFPTWKNVVMATEKNNPHGEINWCLIWEIFHLLFCTAPVG